MKGIKMNLWEEIELINNELQKEILVVPFCYNINGKYIQQLIKAFNTNERLEKYVFNIVTSYYTRAYQMEYRYKHMDIFEPFLKLLECVNYDLFNGNITCAYLSLIPIIEAVLIRWKEKIKNITSNKIRASIPEFIKEWKYENNVKIQNNEKLKKCFEYEIDYMKYTLDLYYQDFDTYKGHNFSDTFNRNLSLHKLEGISSDEEIYRNLNRLFLLIDVIADLYTLTDHKKYFEISMNVNRETDEDFKERLKYYGKVIINRLNKKQI